MSAAPEAVSPTDLWRRFGVTFASASGILVGVLYLSILALDPYGARASPGRPPTPLMDQNQRFMYPQVVRSGRYDSALFGTSTIRLLDPRRLGELFGARFANLGLNAGTPWEQIQIADLFLRHVPRPKVMIFGIDTTWCAPDAAEIRVTFRSFPPWLYDEDPWNDLAHLFDLRSLEIAARVALYRLGFMHERIRGDGYEVFTPPESAYDLQRARAHIRAGTLRPPGLERSTAGPVSFPALPWLDDVLARIPESTAKILVFLPIHAAAQARPGSADERRDELCKADVAEIARRHGATLVDFRRRSPVTMADSNYWDALHYRLGIADRVAQGLWETYRTGSEPADGFYRILARAAPPAPR